MQVKYKRNISFPDARKIVDSYMGTQSYASTSQKINRIQQIESKQENKYIEFVEKLARLSASERPNFQEQMRKSYHATREESKRPENDNVAKTENRPDSTTKSIPPNNNTPKPKPQHSRGITEKRNKEDVPKETQANSTATEKIPSQSKDPVAPIESKNRSSIWERMEIEKPNPTTVKAKKFKKQKQSTRIKYNRKWTILHSYSGSAEELE